MELLHNWQWALHVLRTHPDDLLDPPAELLVRQNTHDLDVRIPIEGFGCELTLKRHEHDTLEKCILMLSLTVAYHFYYIDSVPN